MVYLQYYHYGTAELAYAPLPTDLTCTSFVSIFSAVSVLLVAPAARLVSLLLIMGSKQPDRLNVVPPQEY